MIIYKDLFTGDEMSSDSYPIEDMKNGLWKFTCKTVTETNDIDDRLIGGNKSQEDEGETLESNSKTGINIVLCHKLKTTRFPKKVDLKNFLKDFCKSVLDKLNESCPEKAEKFRSEAPQAVKYLLQHYKDLEYFVGENFTGDGPYTCCFLDYEDDGITPYLLMFADAMEPEKC